VHCQQVTLVECDGGDRAERLQLLDQAPGVRAPDAHCLVTKSRGHQARLTEGETTNAPLASRHLLNYRVSKHSRIWHLFFTMYPS